MRHGTYLGVLENTVPGQPIPHEGDMLGRPVGVELVLGERWVAIDQDRESQEPLFGRHRRTREDVSELMLLREFGPLE
jgi:hypothetical protein